MANIKFYIFGVPDGFDIYQEQYDDVINNYYLCFYEDIEENTKFTIHRKPNGDVSYTFLKYHLQSKSGREGSFFGMSVVFEKGYYADPSSLYSLLETTYENILKKEVLLRPISSDKTPFAQFIPSKFSEKRDEIKRIESFVLGNLKDPEWFAEYKEIDPTFQEGKPNTIRKIPFRIYPDKSPKEKETNLQITKLLKGHYWLALSPDYHLTPSPSPSPSPSSSPSSTPPPYPGPYKEELDPETKKRYTDDFEPLQAEVLRLMSQRVSLQNKKTDPKFAKDIDDLDRKVRTILSTLSIYAKGQNELQILLKKYSDLTEKINILKKRDKIWDHTTLMAGVGGVSILISIIIFLFLPKFRTGDNNLNNNDTIKHQEDTTIHINDEKTDTTTQIKQQEGKGDTQKSPKKEEKNKRRREQQSLRRGEDGKIGLNSQPILILTNNDDKGKKEEIKLTENTEIKIAFNRQYKLNIKGSDTKFNVENSNGDGQIDVDPNNQTVKAIKNKTKNRKVIYTIDGKTYTITIKTNTNTNTAPL